MALNEDSKFPLRLQVSTFEFEANAGSKPFPRHINQVSPDKRKREADDDEGEEAEEILIDGIDCSDYFVSRSGKLAIPDRVWDRASRDFRSEVSRFNQAADKHNAAAKRRSRFKKKHGDKDVHSDDEKDGDEDNAKDRRIQALMSRVEALEKGNKDEKGSNTGASIAGRRGM